METIAAPACPVCSSGGKILYRDLPDRLFGADGLWNFRRCDPGCDTLWLDPIPAELKEVYELYHTHTGPPPADRSSREAFLRRLYRPIKNGYLRADLGYRDGIGPSWWQALAPLAFLHPAGADAIAGDAMFLPAPTPGARLLEIGCGNGAMLEKMRARGWDVEGVEFNPDCVELVRMRGIKCHARDIRELALPASSFDAIYMGHVIEHLYQPRNLLRECARVLKPDGELRMSTPNAASWGHRHFQHDWRGLEAPRHLQIFTPQTLRRLTEESGFGQCRVRTTNRSAWYMLGMSAAVRSAREETSSHEAAMLSMVSLRALSYELLGRLLRIGRPEVGEEIILSARKLDNVLPK